MNNLRNDPHVDASTINASVFNLSKALDRVEGDLELLQEMADLFLEECPHMVEEIDHAITAGDAQALQHAAHTLKGSVSNFAADKATEASFALEKMGRQQDLACAATALATLTQELGRLTPVLFSLKEKEAA
jgi:two-component system, sensor histidine kinase and response regulator